MKKLRSYLNSLTADEKAAFEKTADTSINYLRNAISKGKKIGIELCMRIYKASFGKVSLADIRPDVNWAEVHAATAQFAK